MKITIDTKKETILVEDDEGNINEMIKQLNEILGKKWVQWGLTMMVPYTYFDTIRLNGKAEICNLHKS